jgi:hypothetical protein
MVCGEAVGVRGLEAPRGVEGVRGLGTLVVGGENDVVGRWGKVCEGELTVLLCVAVATVSLLARENPASVRENLK